MKTLSQLSEQIIEEWAKPKGLCDRTQAQALAQHGKTVEEVGELLEAIAEWDDLIDDPAFLGHAAWVGEVMSKIRLEAGDVIVTLIIQCEIQDYSIEEAIIIVTDLQRQSDSSLSFYIREMKGWIKADAAKMVKLEIGLSAIALERLIKPYGLTLIKCLEAAWDKIRDRRSVTVTTPNGGSVAVKSVEDYRALCNAHDMAMEKAVVAEFLPFKVGDRVTVKNYGDQNISGFLSEAFSSGKGPIYYTVNGIEDNIFYAEELTLCEGFPDD